MYFERIYDEGLAQASYIVACPATGEAVVVDPLRDLDLYFDRLDELEFDLVGVAETHIHADFLSGGRDMARATGATFHISGETTTDWEYGSLQGIDVDRLRDGEAFEVGNIRLEAMHTPGHTPEHISLLVVDTPQSSDPMMALTGDFAFVGDLGRPDLLEKAAGEEGTAIEGARQQFESVRDKLLELPDDVQIWPGHGAGSACGKALGSIPSSTVGYERKNAWWAGYLEEGDVDGFVDELLADQPESPTYFRNMKEMNRDGVEGGDSLPAVPQLTPNGFREARDDGALLLDFRELRDFAQGHAGGAINVPSYEGASDYAGWVVPYDRPLVLLAPGDEVGEATRRLYRVGFTDFVGWIPRNEGYADEIRDFEILSADEVHEARERENALILDVRSRSEYREKHIDGVEHIHYGRLVDHLDELPRDRKIVVHCASGRRASIAAGLLETNGFDDVANFAGDAVAAWEEAGYGVRQ